ncbi:conserved hypothetical protein [Pediculus humanus corporis]|uniref:SAM domain-containing protein n=1 Tax=Pediculus humanus subsp. corporis TaxID=121224 RepID=E0VIQ2_PEDHC|nr:uncharacterized protein Phum_PHUM230740 [Pediculus humanus corporis]EEB13258.1 conserved hypothetical protein [Pediculus humanus corporis]
MATGFTREWIKFFTGCGIPEDIAKMYALIFYENRIQKNMLLDLNKEYLKDMGITVMGDIIAILKNAKLVHKKFVEEKILSDSVDSSVNKVEVLNSESKNTSKRILNRYTRKYNSSGIESLKQVKVVVPNNQNNKVKLSKAKPENQGPTEKPEVSGAKIKKLSLENDNFKVNSSESIEKTTQTLEQAKRKEAKTVFDRLGESSVSSTTSEVSGNSVTSYSSTIREKNLSVFSRLGEKTAFVSSSSEEIIEKNGEQLPYAGILKSGSGNKKNFITSTMRADNEQKISSISKTELKKNISVKDRLGLGGPENKSSKSPLSTGKLFQTKTLNATILEKKNIKRINISNNNTSSGQNVSKMTSEKKTLVTTSKTPLKQFYLNMFQYKNLLTGFKSSKTTLDVKPSSDGNNLKKVRFGSATLRLIPSNTSLEPKQNNIYPKLTMIINNKKKLGSNMPVLTNYKSNVFDDNKISSMFKMFTTD